MTFCRPPTPTPQQQIQVKRWDQTRMLHAKCPFWKFLDSDTLIIKEFFFFLLYLTSESSHHLGHMAGTSQSRLSRGPLNRDSWANGAALQNWMTARLHCGAHTASTSQTPPSTTTKLQTLFIWDPFLPAPTLNTFASLSSQLSQYLHGHFSITVSIWHLTGQHWATGGN